MSWIDEVSQRITELRFVEEWARQVNLSWVDGDCRRAISVLESEIERAKKLQKEREEHPVDTTGHRNVSTTAAVVEPFIED